jgi:hypothetical protein
MQVREREEAGILEPQMIRDAAKKPLRAHVDDYSADLEGRGRCERGGRGARLLKGRVLRLMEDGGWKVAVQVAPDSFAILRKLARRVKGRTARKPL